MEENMKLEMDEMRRKAVQDNLVLINKDEQVLDLHPMYQLLACEQSNYETHICFLKRRKQNQLLGESIQGAYEVEIDGFEEFENLTKSLLDKLPSNKGLK